MYLWNLHFSIVSEARNARTSHFSKETTNKNIQFKKWETWIFNAMLDQTKLWRVLLWIRIYFFFFSKSRSDFRLNLLLLKGKGCVTAQLFLKNGKTLVCNAKTKLSCNREACTKTFCLVLEFGRKFRMHARQTALGQLSL